MNYNLYYMGKQLTYDDVLHSNFHTPYVPFYALNNSIFSDENVNCFLYIEFIKLKRRYSVTRYYNSLFGAFAGTQDKVKFKFKNKEIVSELYIHSGSIYDENKIFLLSLVSKSNVIDYVTTTRYTSISLDANIHKFFISSELLTNPLYVNVLKKIKLNIINDAYAKGISIEIVPHGKIENILFPSIVDISNFKSIVEIQNHFKNEVLGYIRQHPEPVPVLEPEIVDSSLTYESIADTSFTDVDGATDPTILINTTTGTSYDYQYGSDIEVVNNVTSIGETVELIDDTI